MKNARDAVVCPVMEIMKVDQITFPVE
jgi:hypothetical protein